MSGKIVMDFFPIRVWFWNKLFRLETVRRLSWEKDTWKATPPSSICNELISFKPKSLTIQWSHSSFSRFICLVTFREFENCSRHAIINNLHFHVFININTLLLWYLQYLLVVRQNCSQYLKSKLIFFDLMISKNHNSRIIFHKSCYYFWINISIA